MLSLAYLAFSTLLGDLLARRAFSFLSLPHRLSVAFLVGLVFSTWLTYLSSLAFASADAPMFYGNIVYIVLACVVCLILYRLPYRKPGSMRSRAPGSERWDWVTIGFFVAMSAWMMYATLGYRDDELLINGLVRGDFGPNLAIVHNFVWGHNFPTEYPFFSGPPIYYHFLFYFQTANLQYLGLGLVHSLNLLSILSLVAMLILVMVLGETLFASRTVGRLAGILFFFHSTVGYFSFLASQGSPGVIAQKLLHLTSYIASSLPYEDWGLWTLNVYINQRHFASAIGVLLIVLIFLIDRYQSRQDASLSSVTSVANTATAETSWPFVKGFLFSGLLLGTLTLWNGLVFVAAFILLFGFFALFPYRLQLLYLGAATAILAVPQLIYLKHDNPTTNAYPQFHWGFVIDNPTFSNVLAYLGGTIGVKGALIVLAVVLLTWFHRRVFIAMFGLLAVPFLVQFGPQIVGLNHKFINMWLILMNLFAAYALWRLWRLDRRQIIGRTTAIVLFLLTILGGVLNLLPIHNNLPGGMPYKNDPIIDWVHANTRPQDVFLTDMYVQHPILTAGRKLFLGWPGYALSAGYPTTQRENIYKAMFEGREPDRLLELLHQNNIAYVAIDDDLRKNELIKSLNEDVYQKYFPRVFEDTNKRFQSLSIYKVPNPEEWRLIRQRLLESPSDKPVN